jgi:hypothetical protein
MEPDILQALGLGSNVDPYGAEAAALTLNRDPRPQVQAPVDPLYGSAGTPGATPTMGGPLEQARVLARLAGDPQAQQKAPSGGSALERMAGGFSAIGNLPKPSANKFGAIAQGLAAGLGGALKQGSKQQKSSTDSIKERMGILKQLFDMDRAAANDANTRDYRNRSLSIAERRLEQGGGKSEGGDPLLAETRITSILKDHPATTRLQADDDLPANSPRKMKPELRQQLEAELKAERQRLEGLRPGSRSAPSPAAATPQPVAPATNQPAQPAMPAAKRPSAPPPKDLDKFVGQARAAIQAGKDPIAVRDFLHKQYGIDPSYLDE